MEPFTGLDRFGGLLRHSLVKSNEREFYKTLSTTLGFDYGLLHPRVELQKFGTCLHGCSAAENCINMYQHFSGTTPNDVLLDVYTEVLDVNTGDVLSVFTPSFVHRWRAISGILARPAVHFKQPGYHIAVHVRRGDVLVNRFGSKFANDDIFINVARTVQAMLPKAHVHIFSTTFAHTSKEKTYKESQLDIYKRQGFQVHLDNPEIDDLTHFAQADVLICSRSAFSQVISILNAKCILCQHPRATSCRPIDSDNVRFRDIRYLPSNGTLVGCELDNLRHCLETTVLKTKPFAWYI